MLRFILYFILFIILFRLLKSIIGIFLKNKKATTIKNESQKKKSKFENVEDAKYIEIKPEDDKKN
jgi:predicted membrane protein